MIFRNHNQPGYAQISHEVLDDPHLCWKTKGMLSYLLGRPPEWKVRASHLASVSEDGIDAVYSGLKKLEEAHYIWKRPIGGSDPGGYEYHVFPFRMNECPFDGENVRIGKSPVRENPGPGKSHANNKEVFSKKDNNPLPPKQGESQSGKISRELDFFQTEETKSDNEEGEHCENVSQRGKENRERLPRQKLTGKPNPKIAEEHNMLLQITSAWNAHGFPTKAEGITARRKRDLSKMLQQRPEFRDEWRDVMKVASESDFLMGRTEKSGKFSTWKFTLDNFLAHDFFLKIKEGKYTQEEDMSWAHRSL